MRVEWRDDTQIPSVTIREERRENSTPHSSLARVMYWTGFVCFLWYFLYNGLEVRKIMRIFVFGNWIISPDRSLGKPRPGGLVTRSYDSPHHTLQEWIWLVEICGGEFCSVFYIQNIPPFLCGELGYTALFLEYANLNKNVFVTSNKLQRKEDPSLITRLCLFHLIHLILM